MVLFECQDVLLHHLGISLNMVTMEPWPLRIRPRTLAVLAEVLLLRQQQESEQEASGSLLTAKRSSETAIMHVWTQLTTSLADAAVATDIGPVNPADVDDVNVEHLQLIVLLFHSGLSLMPKKTLWFQLCQSIIRVADSFGKSGGASSDYRLGGILPLPLTRLLLLADYVLHYFYDMPTAIVDQVRTVHCRLSCQVLCSFFKDNEL